MARLGGIKIDGVKCRGEMNGENVKGGMVR